jgi:hypothetical protein
MLTPKKTTYYAIAVRDKKLYLVLRLTRNTKGEIFVMFPREDKDWDPHTSAHRDGTVHHKYFDHKSVVRKPREAGGPFNETVTLLTTGFASDQPRKIDVVCETDQFSEVFEIPVSDLRPEKYRTNIQIDLLPPGGQPNIPHGVKIIRQETYQDAVPWIIVTLYDSKA